MDKEADLETFLVKGLFPTGREVGRGAFGRVEEVQIPGAFCVAKRIHDELLRTENAAEVTKKFAQECRLMSTLRHPHIVQFLGICYLPDSPNIPCLVMEKLECDHHKLLETVPDVPMTIKKSILTDVASGIVYLHSHDPPIVHRDLTARNVLLDSALSAKIGDLGVARIVNLSPGELAATMTRGPGNIVYMPPEAMEDHPRYDTSLDVFSFGTLIIFTLTQVYPVLKAATYVDPTTRELHPRSEIERRAESINQLETDLSDVNHPFICLAKQCLENVPEARPTASEIVMRLKTMVLVPYRLWDFNKVEMIRDILDSEAEERRLCKREMHEYGMEDTQQEREGLDTHTEHKPLRQNTSSVVRQTGYSSRLPPNVRTGGCETDILQDTLESITWRKVKKMPKRLESATSVFVNGNIYVGSEKTVLSYSIETDEWSELPKPPTNDFSMAVLNDQLVLVGGVNIFMFTHDISDKLAVWDPDEKKWTYPYPNIPVARCNVCLAGYKGCLIVAGGRRHMPEDGNLITSQIEVPSCSTVDVFDSTVLKWYSGDPLPYECHNMQASVIGDSLYIIGGQNRFDLTKVVSWASLPNLIATARHQNQALPAAAVTDVLKSYCWNVLPPCPHFASSIPFCPSSIAIAADGRGSGSTCIVPLLALGGLTGLQLSMLGELDTTGILKDINMYSPSANRWIKVGELPEACVDCASLLLPTGELFVAGGGRFRSPLNSVYLGKLHVRVEK